MAFRDEDTLAEPDGIKPNGINLTDASHLCAGHTRALSAVFVAAHAPRPLISGFFAGLGTGDSYVTQGTVDTLRAEKKRYLWRVRLYYSYSAEPDFYSGMLLRKFVFEADVDRFMREHPADSTVTVRYYPSRVAWSVILDRDQRSTVNV